jgi:hypothetical protein
MGREGGMGIIFAFQSRKEKLLNSKNYKFVYDVRKSVRLVI